MIKPYELTHLDGLISIENKDMILERNNDLGEQIKGDLGIQIAEDGRVWICINGVSFIRFKPIKQEYQK